MSDSFADLWNSSTPSNNAQNQPKPKLGTPQVTVKRPQYDAFSILSSTSANTSRPASGQSNAASAKVLASASARPQLSATTSKSSDAFSELFSNSAQSKMQNMTMAERAAAAKAEQQKQAMSTYGNPSSSSSSGNNAWAGLDSLASTGSNTADASHDDWDLGLNPTTGPTVANPIVASGSFDDDDDWGLGNGFNATSTTSSRSPVPAPPPQKPVSANIWDELDEFSSQPSRTNGSRDSPSNDFDFGDRENGFVASATDARHDDILGDLAKPVEEIRRSSPAATTPSPQPPPRAQAPASRSTSPPPHILGQLIEMGFSIPEARAALASTETGIDVQAAAEMLLSSGAGGGQASPPPRRERPQPQRADSSTSRPQRERPRERDTESPSAASVIQADKLIAQASEIGISLFKNAGSLWKEGREKVQKAYIERVNSDASGSGRVNNGRPKWMTEQHSGDLEEPQWKQREPENAPEARQRPAPAASTSASPVVANTKPVDLFSSFEDGPSPTSNEPRIYIPKSRRPNATSSRASPAPVRKRTRPVVSASSGAIANSNKHKAVGGEKFKLGQYGDAEQAYTLAIDILPRNHLLLVPLYNNRALTRLKNGDYKGAEGDAGIAISVIGEDWRKGLEEEVTVPEHGAGVDLGDGLVKAWRRRAEALEGREQWEEAMKNWEKVAGADWTTQRMRTDGVQGAGRCRRVLNPKPKTTTPAAPRPAVSKPKPRPPMLTAPSQALDNLRKVNEAADAEEQAKHELKDQVDAKLTGWKGGKETNIRALLASLDSVLWPELGMQKSNMADLLSPNQVKIRYTKAIAKLHPDKLNGNNSTIEQRMIAQGVFGALNEAWNAFKP